VTELSQLTPTQARKILALAATSVLAKEAQRQPTMVPLHIPGSEVTNETIRAGVHLLLEERRRAAGIEPVDISELIICDDSRLRQKRADSVTGTTAAEIAECLAP
jgi:hypothetical protein